MATQTLFFKLTKEKHASSFKAVVQALCLEKSDSDISKCFAGWGPFHKAQRREKSTACLSPLRTHSIVLKTGARSLAGCIEGTNLSP